MQHTVSTITREEVYHIMESTWNIHADFKRLPNISLKRLGITTQDVDWLLFTLAWKYEVKIREHKISLQLKIEEFIQLILK